MEQNQSKTLLAIVGIALVALIGGFLWYSTRSTADDFDFAAPVDRDTLDEKLIAGQSTNIIVYSPAKNMRVGTPIIIEGDARVFENTVSYRLVDTKGGIIAEGFSTADALDIGQFGPFRGELVYQSETDGAGTIEVFWYSAKDGTPADVVTIPVTYTKTPEFIKG